LTVKRRERESDYSPTSSAEVFTVWSLINEVQRQLYIFTGHVVRSGFFVARDEKWKEVAGKEFIVGMEGR
jgi:hypothetical protein